MYRTRTITIGHVGLNFPLGRCPLMDCNFTLFFFPLRNILIALIIIMIPDPHDHLLRRRRRRYDIGPFIGYISTIKIIFNVSENTTTVHGVVRFHFELFITDDMRRINANTNLVRLLLNHILHIFTCVCVQSDFYYINCVSFRFYRISHVHVPRTRVMFKNEFAKK